MKQIGWLHGNPSTQLKGTVTELLLCNLFEKFWCLVICFNHFWQHRDLFQQNLQGMILGGKKFPKMFFLPIYSKTHQVQWYEESFLYFCKKRTMDGVGLESSEEVKVS